MTRVKSPHSEDRMGVYKELTEIPDRYRLKNHAAAYEGEDTWSEYLAARDAHHDLSESYFEIADRAGRNWRAYLSEQKRHHALAQPIDVEYWSQNLLEDRTIRTVYEQYWVQVEQFYTWLQFHTDHPHVYQPVLMAAANYETAGMIWERKIDSSRNSGSEFRDS